MRNYPDLTFLNYKVISSVSLRTNPLQILRLIPGPRTFPVIGAQWLYYPIIGRFKYSKYHESNDEKLAQFGAVVREEVLWNFPLIHLFDSKVSQYIRLLCGKHLYLTSSGH